MRSDPLDRARALLDGFGARPGDVRVVGGLAVRAWLGDLARVSEDVDVVALSAEAHALVLNHLRADGFRLGESGGWWRGLREGPDGREVVDVGTHPVVNPRTFDTIKLREGPRTEAGLVVAGVTDLAYMKLCAGRDQDLVDVCLLASRLSIDARAIAHAAQQDDVERLVARSVIEARFASSRGLLDTAYGDLLGRAITDAERASFDALLETLGKEGGF